RYSRLERQPSWRRRQESNPFRRSQNPCALSGKERESHECQHPVSPSRQDMSACTLVEVGRPSSCLLFVPFCVFCGYSYRNPAGRRAMRIDPSRPLQMAEVPTPESARPRRLRHHPLVRDLVRETELSVRDLILPLFVRPGRGVRTEIASMPGNFQLSIDRLVEAVGTAADLGVRSFILFGIPTHKDATGSSALEDDGIVRQSLRALRKHYKDRILLIADECFCEYTDHGHCGVLSEATGRLDLDNDATLPLLAAQCVSHVRAGADVVAPSGMLDGMVGAIRAGLDAAGFSHLQIMSYSAKDASGFYGAFRDASC